MAHPAGGATQATLNDILKEFYLGPVQEQLNNSVMVLDLMTKTTVDWNGRSAIIPIHVSRNIGVAFAAEGAHLPAAGEQGYQRLDITAHFLYGRFQITGPAMSAAGKGGANSFIGWMEAEMDKLVNDVKNASDNAMISGGRLLGFLNQRRASVAGVAPGVDVWEFFGDCEKTQALLTQVTTQGAAVTNALLVDLVRVDNNAALGYTVINTEVALTATDVIGRTVTLSGIDNNGIGAVATDTTAVDDGRGIAVVVSTVQQVVDFSAAAAAVVGAPEQALVLAITNGLNDQPQGIFANLGSRTHFTVDRFSPPSATSFPALQSTIMTQGIGAAPSGDRVALSLPRMQAVMDQVNQFSGEEPDCILISPLARQQYAAMFQLTAASSAVMNTSGESAGKLDGGFSGLSYGGLPIKTARHVGGGGMIFLKLSSWKVLELESHGFADLDGSVLARAGVGASGVDAYEGYYRWYYNTVTTNPNQNGILCGFSV
jgi:hypothetical protein